MARLIKMVLAVTICCTLAVKAEKSPEQILNEFSQCSEQLQTLGQCVNNTNLKFNVTKYESDILKCYSDNCNAQPPFAVDTPDMVNSRENCASSLNTEYTNKIAACLQERMMRYAAAFNIDNQQIPNGALRQAAATFIKAARIRYQYLVGGDKTGTGINHIPNLILPKTMTDNCGNVKMVNKVKSCIQRVRGQAKRDFNKYKSSFDKCYNNIKKCFDSYNLVERPICACENQELRTMNTSMSSGECSPQAMNKQADAPIQLMQQLQVCDNEGKVANEATIFKVWWQDGLSL